MKVNLLYKCKSCGQVFIWNTMNYKSENVNIKSALIHGLTIIVHECEEDTKFGIAELIGVEKVIEE